MGDNDKDWIDRLPPLERDLARRELSLGDGLDGDYCGEVWGELFMAIVPQCASRLDISELSDKTVAMSVARGAENLADAAFVVS